ncbi:MAG: BON domain-containing protein [Planctomycetaceae bacterium]|nr:BON domain-containing protein [Planctomycetaceae bacterium]
MPLESSLSLADPRAPELDLSTRVRLSLSRLDFCRVSIHVDAGTVTLGGTVSSFYQKQVSQEFARRVAGVQRVINDIQVREIDASLDVPHIHPAIPA